MAHIIINFISGWYYYNSNLQLDDVSKPKELRR